MVIIQFVLPCALQFFQSSFLALDHNFYATKVNERGSPSSFAMIDFWLSSDAHDIVTAAGKLFAFLDSCSYECVWVGTFSFDTCGLSYWLWNNTCYSLKGLDNQRKRQVVISNDH
ncbi:hypothetical protein DL96DRAFT_1643037 [Flagelloscypha sp. PMI_526]|nr:hypothetical protein DL96DRAFT_1643037 [Flagelloscypha sp. PMI_526]